MCELELRLVAPQVAQRGLTYHSARGEGRLAGG